MRCCFLVFVAFMFSCNNSAKPPVLTEDSAKPDGTELNDTTTIISTDTAQAYSAKVLPPAATKLPLGFYRVKLPCDNCPKIEQTVYFERNKTFLMEERDPDSTSGITRTTGSFNPADGTVWAYKGQVVKARYTWGGDTLYYLLPNSKRLPMQKLIAATDNEAWKKKGKEGLLFFGVGNEPFWNLEINKQEHVAFHQAEWAQPLLFDSVSVTATEDSLVYTAASDTASLKAVIYNRFCSDGMSDYIYPNSIKVVYNGKTFKGCGIKYRER